MKKEHDFGDNFTFREYDEKTKKYIVEQTEYIFNNKHKFTTNCRKQLRNKRLRKYLDELALLDKAMEKDYCSKIDSDNLSIEHKILYKQVLSELGISREGC